MGPFDHTIDVSIYYPCGVHEISPLQSIKTLEMGDENMEKRKFKVGDKIRIVSCVSSYNGKIATIIYFDGNDYRPYHVRVHETKNTIYLNPVWERKHVKEMTIAEIEKELGYAIKVVKEKK